MLAYVISSMHFLFLKKR